MILRKGQPRNEQGTEDRAREYGAFITPTRERSSTRKARPGDSSTSTGRRSSRERFEPSHGSNLDGDQTPRVPQSRSLYRWIFPVAVFGSSGTNSIQRGYLYGASLPFTNSFSASA